MGDYFLPGSASLVDLADKKLSVSLRDGRTFIGTLRTYDQFANLVLQDTIERTIVGDIYGEVQHGIFVIRGENVVLLGEIDPHKEEISLSNLKKVTPYEAMSAFRDEKKLKKQKDFLNGQVLHRLGFDNEPIEHDNY
ncbi:SM-like, degradation of cytoplasmic mRNAs and positively regulates transcription initiation [Clydaea vesicula]|uniref:U6 snRNA-associated Sm-like protein LSm1 n=1 Tax=Clydaea vesicula TaxID=447962 RepID=A0AAD5TV69_9FUNG|nr:SM-like, degradation of cytoplasmic mRNAs and positively regulates transcription initiation [Clydaea vesicula]KAJ3385218.1 SM-like, degradation of cytoplasmic mRNAs and positively regulates transcription initiation [Lobulomyces angularis]